MKIYNLALASIFAINLAGCSRVDAPLPRYYFKPGEVLDYEFGTVFKYQTGKFIYTEREKTWVVSQNPDGSWVLLVKDEFKTHREDSRFHDPDRTQIIWTRSTRFPDGHSTGTESTGESGNQEHSLPVAPSYFWV